jgi:hypothetical protein
MSYDYDADGGKVFCEPEDVNPLNFCDWHSWKEEDLIETFIDNNPEDFPTDESMLEVVNHYGFQTYCEEQYDKYVRGYDDSRF